MTFSVAVLFLKGGLASTALHPLEIFLSTGLLWNLLNDERGAPGFHVTTASIDGACVRIDKRLSLTPECSFPDLSRPDLVFVPAGGCDLDTMVRETYDISSTIQANIDVVPWLQKWASEGAKIAAACSGVLLQAQAGLLDGKIATAHWGLVEAYRRHFPRVDWRGDYLVTDADDVFCGGGVNAAADLALYLVEKHCGREAALQTARALLIEMPRTWQSSFSEFPNHVDHRDPQVLQAETWIRKYYASHVSFHDLAQKLGMSFRNFSRRFKSATGETPLSYLQGIRVGVAKNMLVQSTCPVQDICARVGYDDQIFFRALFRRHTGMAPNDYRARFGTRRANNA